MKYNRCYRKLSTVNGRGFRPELCPADVDPTPATVEGARSLVERFYAMKKKNAFGPSEKKLQAPRYQNVKTQNPTADKIQPSGKQTARKMTTSKAKNKAGTEYSVQMAVSRPATEPSRNRTPTLGTFAEDQGDSSSPKFLAQPQNDVPAEAQTFTATASTPNSLSLTLP